MEMIVTWEDRIKVSNVLKMQKYSDFVKDLEESRFQIKSMPVEVGVRGFVGKSARTSGSQPF